jgi:hypothetical protein
MITARQIYISALGLLLLTAFTGCRKVGENKMTTMKIEDPVRHYTPIMQGTKQIINVKVTNTGNEPLLLKNVLPSCGCTTATFPSHAIAPGNDAEIELHYDSTKNNGYTEIYTTIMANVPVEANTVFFDINVVPNSHYTKDYEEIYFENKGNNDKREQVNDETHIKTYIVN